ncbi:MAG: pantoate--beta-alanine ligase [Acidobacteria bacterium]|nr:pantoate--beta-alanine ligase [Acidobacteriota bacterium]
MSLEVFRSISPLRERLAEARRAGGGIGLVPTMGALHRGHLGLIERARRENRTVTVSIFVNPLQFNQPQDYERYPVNLEGDLSLSAAAGVDVVFAPPAGEMYPAPPLAVVEVSRLSDHLCGAHRPGHFRGVATVVMKLLQITQPDRAYFGEKDAQQLAIIERMVRDLNVPVAIVPVATVREPDGLALSSRNQLLSPEERQAAPALYAALQAAAAAVARGERDADALRREVLANLERHPAIRLEYLEIVGRDMQPLTSLDGPARIAAAIWLGQTRLIDNVLLNRSSAKPGVEVEDTTGV